MLSCRHTLRNMAWARVFLSGCLVIAGWNSAACADSFTVTNLVTNDQSANPAQITDPRLVNAWGISNSSTTPFWVSDNGTGLSTLYSVDPTTNATTSVIVAVGDHSGRRERHGTGFQRRHGLQWRPLPVRERGRNDLRMAWRPRPHGPAEILQTGLPDINTYKGAALVTIGANSYLLAANFKSGAIDVLKGTPGSPDLTGKFTDPNLPAGYAPFDIRLLGDKLYVTYALQGPGKDEQHGAGLGIVNVFDTQGNLLQRLASDGGPLNAPWGLAIAPSSFRSFAGDLLVGNFGDGTINAFDLTTDKFVGQLLGTDGKPVVIDGLWGLTAGNGAGAGSMNTIYFSAGPQDESNGVFGALERRS